MRGFHNILNSALAGQGAINAALTSSRTNQIHALAAGAAPVVPGAVPIAPGPGDVFKEGGDCTFTWTADPSGQWKEMYVQLMSGDNWNMVPVTTIGKFDGTDPKNTTYTYGCPDVDVNSAIYFYQFSTPAAPKNLTWTTRWTLAATDGSSSRPANSTQPDGQNIPWGVGKLADQHWVVPPPDYLGGPAANSSSTTTTSSSATTSSSTTTNSSSTTTTDSTTTTTSADSGSGSDPVTVTNVKTADPSGSTGGSNANSSSNQNNANGSGGANENGATFGAHVNVALGTAALAVLVALLS